MTLMKGLMLSLPSSCVQSAFISEEESEQERPTEDEPCDPIIDRWRHTSKFMQ